MLCRVVPELTGSTSSWGSAEMLQICQGHCPNSLLGTQVAQLSGMCTASPTHLSQPQRGTQTPRPSGISENLRGLGPGAAAP